MNLPKGSFFDDPKSNLWIKEVIQASDPKISGTLIKNSKLGIQKESNYFLQDGKLACQHKYIDLQNATLEKIKDIGFKLTKNRKSVELLTHNEEAQGMWYKQLKQYCIQRGFNNVYSINKLIGKGNFAKVYSASKKSDHSTYAVKAFDKLKFQDIRIDKPALIKELSIMRKMEFVGVIKLCEVFENDNYIFMVCELLEGGELFNQMKGKAYDEKTVAHIMFRILQSIDYIHSVGVLHRDIKPENLILRSKRDMADVVIADFGLADFYNQEGDYMFKRCGTPGYVAPELLQDKIYDYKIDIFSAGVLMFIMLTGQSPFKAQSYDEIVMKNYHCQIEFSLIKNQPLSEEAVHLLTSLLEKNPDLRISSELALQHPWFQKQGDHKLILADTYPKHKKNSELYAKTPLMGQELNQSITSTPLSVTPQMRSKSNTTDQQKEDQLTSTSRQQSQSLKIKKQECILEENEYNVNEEDDVPHSHQIKMYQIQPKLKRNQEEQKQKQNVDNKGSLQFKI
ncbi:unnamed protein product (macronuclear) [Paramecium tetraurelia]|uniref:Protein kinase domain-containing protein n=1 Tax=Paramecium tetraurelia TaxID=5888 RepID=A0CCR6_PARTE|nr:uncharacterized protein GSPATT00037368001 [Paramecium tetraurelia]CAK68583.1 unnamed protein product [Paramecium tetraurelia]|eukprot:XP_001435980.1 hypothetical protein (macronuclear) [Paramecium tetraurelia strain d4-2]